MRTTLQVSLFVVLLVFAVSTTAQAQQAPAEAAVAVRVSAASPNPFAASTSFTVSVDAPQEVTVELYNLLGQRVAEVYRGPMERGESRAFTVAADGLPAGLYLYRVQAGKTVVSRQVTLIR